MAAPIDPPRTPQAPVVRVLAQAALQRQAMLQDAMAPKDGAAPAASASATAAPPAPAAPGGQAMRPQAGAPPADTDRLDLSPQTRASLRQDAAGTLAQGRAAPSPAAAPAALAAAPAPPAGAAAVAALWPATGVAAPLRQMLAELLRQLPLPGGKPAQLLAAHPWPAGVAQALQAGEGEHALPGLPALRTWLVAQGQVLTPQGARPFAMTLRLPLAWLQGAAALPASPQPLAAAFAGSPQRLETGLFALALQLGGPAAARTSALLTLEFAPQAAPLVYGREALLPRAGDPWLQLAALQASGQWREQALEGDEPPARPPCREAGCPYEGRASCVQPFCLALRVPPPPR